MKPAKTWNTINEETLQRAAAGWVWLNSYMEGRGTSLPIGTRIGDAVMSKWVPPCVILHHNVADGPTIASMGNRTWAALGVPLQEMEINGVAHYTFNLRAGVKWQHIIDPEQWNVIPFIAWRDEVHGVLMKAAGTPQSLPKHCLLSKGLNLLTAEDLQRLVKHLNLPQPDSGDPAETDPPQLTSMISALAQYFCLEVADCLANFQERGETDDCLLHDPFAEAVYQDLDPEDKLEFGDFGQSLKQRKIRQAQHALGRKRRLAMSNFQGRGRGRRRSGGRGRGRQGPPSGPGGNESQQGAPVAAAATAEPSESGPEGNEPQQAAPVAAAATAQSSPPPLPPPPLSPVGAAELEEQGAAAPGEVQAHPRGANVLDQLLGWTQVLCTHCGQVAGEYKYHPSPGSRDPASWTMRCVEDYHTQTMGTRAPFRQTRVASRMNQEEVIRWIQDFSNCCLGRGSRPSSG